MTVLQDGWKQLKLKNVAPLQRGFDLTKSALNEGNVPVISSSGLWGYHDEAKVDAPGIVIGRYGTLGEVFFIEEDFWPHNTTLWVTDFCGNDPKFIDYVYRSFNFARFSGKTGVPGLNRNDLHSVKISLPPLIEQREIAAILSTWDRAIELTEKLIAAKQKRKHALMQQLLTGKVRLPGFEKSVWTEESLGSLLREVKRDVEWDDDEEYRLLSIRRRSGGFFDRESKFGRDIKTKNLMTTETGDFVIARMQAVHGAIAVTPSACNGKHVSSSYSTFVCSDAGVLHMPFLNYVSRTSVFYHSLWLSSYGVTIEKMTFNLRWFLRERIWLPPTLEEQEKIADVLNCCESELGLLERKVDALKRQKKGLMQQLLTGKTRVKVAAEVA